MKRILRVVSGIVVFILSQHCVANSSATLNESLADFDSLLEWTHESGEPVFATGCAFVDDDYVEDGSRYIVYWVHNIGEMDLFVAGRFYQIGPIHYLPEEGGFAVQPHGGLASHALAWDVWRYLKQQNFKMFTRPTAAALYELAGASECRGIPHPSMDSHTGKTK